MAWELKYFWKKQIKKLLSFKGVESYLLFTDKTWWQQLYEGNTWQEVNDIALDICQNLYDNATVEITPPPTNLENLLADLRLLEHISLEGSDTESDDNSEKRKQKKLLYKNLRKSRKKYF